MRRWVRVRRKTGGGHRVCWVIWEGVEEEEALWDVWLKLFHRCRLIPISRSHKPKTNADKLLLLLLLLMLLGISKTLLATISIINTFILSVCGTFPLLSRPQPRSLSSSLMSNSSIPTYPSTLWMKSLPRTHFLGYLSLRSACFREEIKEVRRVRMEVEKEEVEDE